MDPKRELDGKETNETIGGGSDLHKTIGDGSDSAKSKKPRLTAAEKAKGNAVQSAPYSAHSSWTALDDDPFEGVGLATKFA